MYSLEGIPLNEKEIQEEKQRLEELRKSEIALLLKYGANINVLDKDGNTLFDNCLQSGNYELMELFTDIASFSAQPALLFSFAKLIYNPTLKQTFNFLLKNSVMNSQLLSVTDNEGFTPFLRYLKTFTDIAQDAYTKIYTYIEYTLKRLKYEGAQNFDTQTLQITYDNYMNFNIPIPNNFDDKYRINNYILYFLLKLLGILLIYSM